MPDSPLVASAPGVSPVPGEDIHTPRPFRIVQVKREVAGVFTWKLAACDGNPCACRPGQFNMLTAFGVGEVPISVSGDCRNQGELVHTIRAVGPVTRAMENLKRGAVVGVAARSADPGRWTRSRVTMFCSSPGPSGSHRCGR